MSKPRLGAAVVNGELQYTSPSAMGTFEGTPKDPGCQRQWGFRYISRIKDPPKGNAIKGIAGHDRIDHHFKTGEDVLTNLEAPIKQWIPKPFTEGIISEPPIDLTDTIIINSIPIALKVDMLNLTGLYVNPRGELIKEPYPEVLDWKYSGDPDKWAKTSEQLRTIVPMTCYGLWGLRQVNTTPEKIRLSHVNIGLRKRVGFKRTALVTPAELEYNKSKISETIGRMKIAAGATDPNDLPGNPDACGRFNGCPYRDDQCIRSKAEIMRSIQGPKPTKGKPMSNPFQTTPETPTTPAIDIKAQLLAQEAAAKEDPRVEQVRNFLHVIENSICVFGDQEPQPPGMPQLSGEAAELVAAATHLPLKPGEGIVGSGFIGDKVNCKTFEDLCTIAEQCRGALVQGHVIPPRAGETPPALVAPTTAPVVHALAADPIPPEDALTMSPTVQAAAAAHREANAAAQPPAPPAPSMVPSGGFEIDQSELTRARAAKKPKKDWIIILLQAELNALAAQVELGTPQVALTVETAPVAPEKVSVYVNVVNPGGAVTEDLTAYVDKIHAELCEAGSVPHLLHLGDHKTLGFGKWKGFVLELVASSPIPPGTYSMHTPNEIGLVVLEGLRQQGADVYRGF